MSLLVMVTDAVPLPAYDGKMALPDFEPELATPATPILLLSMMPLNKVPTCAFCSVIPLPSWPLTVLPFIENVITPWVANVNPVLPTLLSDLLVQWRRRVTITR